MHPTDARDYLVRPVLKHLSPEIPYTIAAEELVHGTLYHESMGYTRVRQVIAGGKRGRGRGYAQVEPATLKWMLEELRKPRHARIAEKIAQLEPQAVRLPGERAEADILQRDPAMAVAFARFRYWLVPRALPRNVPKDMAAYWAKYYNTVQPPSKWLHDYRRMLRQEAK